MDNPQTDKIRVMVVDDSTYMRYVITQILESCPDVEVVEKARNGVDALEKLAGARPDVITLDIQMPEMDGLRFLEEVRKSYRIPTIMLSSLTFDGAEDTIRALELGAVDFVPKPTGIASLTLDDVGEELIRKVKMAAMITPSPLEPPLQPLEDAARGEAIAEAGATAAAPASARRAPRRKPLPRKVPVLKKIVAVACSTGGPRALTEIIPLLPKDLDACIIVVQHMPATFTRSLADRLAAISQIRVAEAREGDRVEAGAVYIAPGDFHLRVAAGDAIILSQDAPRHGVRPCADVMMESVAEIYGARAVGIVLTGMGSDGSLGAKSIKERGGFVIAEHESTCVVYGMPKAAVAAGAADRVLILPLIADTLLSIISS